MVTHCNEAFRQMILAQGDPKENVERAISSIAESMIGGLEKWGPLTKEQKESCYKAAKFMFHNYE